MSQPVFNYDWFTPIIPIIDRALRPLAGKHLRGLEIGSFEGRSTLWFLENILTHPHSVITCVDHFLGGSDHKGLDLSGLRQRFFDNTRAHQEKIELMPLSSWEALHWIRSEAFEFVFVDGSHESQDVLHDAVESFRLVRKNGILIFDDYGWGMDRPSRPQIGIDAFLSAFAEQVEVLEKAYAITLRKR